MMQYLCLWFGLGFLSGELYLGGARKHGSATGGGYFWAVILGPIIPLISFPLALIVMLFKRRK